MIGASAGGLEALRQVVPALPFALPAGPQLVVIVALHLSPNHRSMLAELLARETPAPVQEVSDGMQPQPGQVYVVPAGTQLELIAGAFHLVPLTTAGVPKPNIDRIFGSAAQAYGEHTIAVVLSGTGSDGSRGVRAVRAAGGLVIVQDPGDARFDSMPAHAVDSGAANHVVPAAEVADVVARLMQRQLPRAPLELADEAGLEDIQRCVRNGIGFDIGAYKPTTVRRRLERRMRARSCQALAEYVALLEHETEEQHRLVQELLISVTGFFRDADVFEQLAVPLAKRVRQAAAEDRELRVWVAGCATGDEAYTLALVLERVAEREGVPLRLRLFATDIDAPALELARRGVYAASAWAEVPEQWRGPQLLLDGDVMRVGPGLRERVLFSEHNVLRDPPFLRIDLLACRNLMIYLQPRWQRWLLQQFQLSLADGGLLLLGRSESLPSNDAFEALAEVEVPALYQCLGRGSALLAGSLMPELRRSPSRPGRAERPVGSAAADLLLAAHQQGAFGPALAMTGEGMLLHTFGDLSQHLQFNRGGPASLNLSELAPARLWVELRGLAYRARNNTGHPQTAVYEPEDGSPAVRLVGVSVRGTGAILVLFQPTVGVARATGAASDEVQTLREHVNATREHLQTLVSELDAANEELQLLNEELQSGNEELQSTNEELQTSNEELQSTNEELTTVNEELQVRTAELGRLNADLQNVKNSLIDPLLVLDQHGRVLLRNPAAESLFKFEVEPSATSERPLLAALPTRLPAAPLQTALRELLAGGAPSDMAFRGLPELEGRSFNLRLQPYLDQHGQRRGAVLLFQDISALQRLQDDLVRSAAELRGSEAFRRATVDALPDTICVLDDEGHISGVNQAWNDNLITMGVKGLVSASLGASYLDACKAAAAGGDTLAHAFLNGLQRVRARESTLFVHEYPCGHAGESRWFRATVTPFGGSKAGVVVRHQNISELHHQRDQLLLQSRALDASINGVVIADASKAELPMIYVNRAFELLTGYAASEVVGRSCALLQGLDRQQSGLTTLRSALQRRENVRVLLRNYRKSGEMFWNELSVSMVTDDAGNVTHMVGVQRDVTALIASEEALRAAQRREAQALAFAGLGTLDWRLRDGQLLLSQQQARLFGLPGEQDSIRWSELQQRVHPDDLPVLSDAVKLCVAGHAQLDVEWRVRDSAGGWRWLHLRGDVERDHEATATHLMAICQDVTTRRAAEERATFISQHDALTGLPNRTLLRDRLQMAIRSAARARSRLALMFLDLDRFKEVNDSLGHEAGDELLRSVADRLRNSVRSSDTVCRLGGDEFVLLLPAVADVDEAGQVANKVLVALKQPIALRGQDVHVSGSIGVCLYPDDGTDADTLMRHADAAMYRAKGGGRNDVCFYAQAADAHLQQTLTMRAEMAVALASDQLRLHVQPQISLDDGRLVGLEALLRWQHPERGLLMPDQFAGVLEDSSLVNPIGRWVLAQACRLVVAWRGTAAGGVPMAVNVSALQLRDGDFVRVVNEVLGASGARPDEIEIEVTERAMLNKGASAGTALADLRGLGIGIALDDFGTGFSSLSHLHQHPISKLKIDRSFCAPLPADRSAAAIVRAIIQMARTLGLAVVAEGVELADQAEFLREAGCASVQGYLHTPALAPQEALAWVTHRRSLH